MTLGRRPEHVALAVLALCVGVLAGSSARAADVHATLIDAINARKPPSLADAREKTCFAVASEVLANKGLSDESYAAAEKTMGLESLVALIATIGSFSMTCLTAATFVKRPVPVAVLFLLTALAQERRHDGETVDGGRHCCGCTGQFGRGRHEILEATDKIADAGGDFAGALPL